jgi:hypothetical protein
MPLTTASMIRQERLCAGSLLASAAYAVLGPLVNPAVALGMPLRIDVLVLCVMGLMALGHGPMSISWPLSHSRTRVLPVVVGALVGAALVAPLVAVPWLLAPGVALAWTSKGRPGRARIRGPTFAVALLAACINCTGIAALSARGLRVPPEAFGLEDSRANHLLADIPLNDVWAVDLKGPATPTITDLVQAVRQQPVLGVTPAMAGLGLIRGATGHLLGWDDPRWADTPGSFLDRLTEADRHRSSTKPGTARGMWRVLYAFPREGAAEGVNGTVHVAVAGAIEDIPEGVRLYLAFWVREVNWTTRPYMTFINPPRRFFIYPFLLRQLAHTWERSGLGTPNDP